MLGVIIMSALEHGSKNVRWQNSFATLKDSANHQAAMRTLTKRIEQMESFDLDVTSLIYDDYAEGVVQRVKKLDDNMVENWRRDLVDSWTVQNIESMLKDEDNKKKIAAVAAAAADLADIETIFTDLNENRTDEKVTLTLKTSDGDRKMLDLESIMAEKSLEGKLLSCSWSVWRLVLERGAHAQAQARGTLVTRLEEKIKAEVGNAFFAGLTAMMHSWSKDGIVRQ